ncbi:MAG: imidazole glycerol phosphate synthase subunit HisH [Rhodomicrobium sp.]
MLVAIVDYQSGNLHSAAKAFERAARESGIAAEISVTSDPGTVKRADRIVLPGVGAFGDCYRGLESTPGMIEALQEAVLEGGRPFFGICVGMQLLANRGLEHGTHEGLGWIGGEVTLIQPADKALKVPHMGWNTLSYLRSHPLFEGIPGGAEGWHAYFVHSYQFRAEDPSDVAATADYGGAVTAAIARGNIAGSQFHPEKSQKLGLKLISNFLKWRP